MKRDERGEGLPRRYDFSEELPYQIEPEPAVEAFGALKESILRLGVLTPVVIVKESQEIVDGHTRIRAYQELQDEGRRLPPCPVTYLLGYDEAEIIERALDSNEARRQNTPEDRQGVAARVLMRIPQYSLRRLAQIVGCSHMTIRKVKERLIEEGKLSLHEKARGLDGRMHPTKMPGSRRPAKSSDERESHRRQKERNSPSAAKLHDAVSDEELAASDLIDLRGQFVSGSWQATGLQLIQTWAPRSLDAVLLESTGLVPAVEKFRALLRICTAALKPKGLLIAHVEAYEHTTFFAAAKDLGLPLHREYLLVDVPPGQRLTHKMRYRTFHVLSAAKSRTNLPSEEIVFADLKNPVVAVKLLEIYNGLGWNPAKQYKVGVPFLDTGQRPKSIAGNIVLITPLGQL